MVLDWRLWIVKIDSNGNIGWQKTFGGSSNDVFQSVKQTSDGGFILGGSSRSNISLDKSENCIGGDDYWVIKTDGIGNIEWENTIGGIWNDFFSSAFQTSDGGYILGGKSESWISGDKTQDNIGLLDYWIIKIDSLGNLLWQQTIGGLDNDCLNSIEPSNDGGYIMGGWSESNISRNKAENMMGGADYWIVKTDSIGDILWENTIGGMNYSSLMLFNKLKMESIFWVDIPNQIFQVIKLKIVLELMITGSLN